MKLTLFFLLLPVFGQDTIGEVRMLKAFTLSHYLYQEQGRGVKEKFTEKEHMQEQEKLQVKVHGKEQGKQELRGG